MRAIVAFLVDRPLVVNLISILLLVLGAYAMVDINREAFPNVNLDKIEIHVAYPGATPPEIERLVVTPIEQELKSVDGIDTMVSVAFPGSARITLEVDPDAPNRNRVVSDVQLAVDRADLPNDLPGDPVVSEIDGAMIPILRLAVGAPVSSLELKRLGDRIEDDLLNLPGVGKVIVQGKRKAQIRVVVDPEALRRHHIPVGQVAELLANWNVNLPAGDLTTPEGQKSVRIKGEFSGPEDVADLVLRTNDRGRTLRLGDVAQVTETLEEARIYYDIDQKPALSILVLKKPDADIIDTVDAVRAYLDTVPERYGAEVEVKTFQDFSRFARLRLGVLTNNGLVGLVLVFVSLILFLRPSVALTTTWGLPIVFFTGLYALYLSGITLNLISMLGFIIVLGMLVDDAIIVGENITYHMERGMAPRDAAVTGAVELIGPVTATVLTTIVAFLPMLFMSGIIGKFIVAIPVVVISLLVFSWLESFLILPSHVAHIANPRAHPKERAIVRWLEAAYAVVLKWALKLRWLTVALSFAALAGTLVLAKKSDFELFPAVGVDQYVIRVTAPAGTSLDQMRALLREIDREARLRLDEKHLEATLLTAGKIALDEGDPLTQRGSRFGQIRVIYTPAVLRPGHDALDDMHRLAKELPPLFPDLLMAFTVIKPGPPTGRPLEAHLSADDPALAETAARRLMDYLQTIDGVVSVESGLVPGDPELHVVVDRARAAYARVDLATIAAHVRAAVDGLTVTHTRRGSEEIDVTVLLPKPPGDESRVLDELEIPNARGALVPLSKIATVVEEPGYTTIRHQEGVRVINVTANIDSEKITSVRLNRLVREHEGEWLGDLAGKVEVSYGGEEEKNQESVRDLAFSFVFALLAIFFILAVQFNNLSYPLVVMLSIPFGAIGIVVSFYLHDLFWQHTPLSFLAMLGMVALSGVVVNSALVLLVFVQRAIQGGTPPLEALMLAGRRRLRAVLLTAITTVVGLLPTAYGWGGYDPFVAPMALALASGLAFATVITLVTLPAVFAVGVDLRNAGRWVWRRLSGRDGAAGA